MTLIIILVIVALVVMYGINAYNGLVKLRNMVENAWAQIDVQLKRRIDLIPNILETVKGYAKHEQETFEKVIQARNMASNATTVEESIDANNQLTGTLKSLFAVAEAYPDLKANQNFINLQNELTGTEDKIMFARQFYNDTVTKFNIAIQSFPASIIAGMFGFKEATVFTADEADRAVPEVKF